MEDFAEHRDAERVAQLPERADRSPGHAGPRADTAAIAVADSGAIASPAPIPTRTSPGITTAQPEPVLITPCASAPAAMTSSPLPISSRGDVVCRIRPIEADTANAARLAGSRPGPP